MVDSGWRGQRRLSGAGAVGQPFGQRPPTQGELVQLIVDRPQFVTPGTG